MDKKLEIIAVDFDGTLVKNKYPEIGEANPDILEYCIKKRINGAKIVLWTNRVDEYLNEAISWCEDHGLVFDAVNDNIPEIIDYFGSNTRKIFANEYIDDRMSRTFRFGTDGSVEIVTPFKGNYEHMDICYELNNLYTKKNADYGDSFHSTFEEEGFAMARIRLSDKLNRFKVLSKGNDICVKDESIRDTLVDLANYAIMTIMEMDRSHPNGKQYS